MRAISTVFAIMPKPTNVSVIVASDSPSGWHWNALLPLVRVPLGPGFRRLGAPIITTVPPPVKSSVT